MDIRISDSEFIVMEALWHHHPLTAEMVVEATAAQNNWKGNTVRTMLTRLLKKGVIEAERVDRKNFYTPAISREKVVGEKSVNLLKQLFDGKLAPLVSHLSKDKQLSAEDVAELKRLINAMEDDV